MGLDIYFSKAKALAAGLVITEETNGTPEDIARASEDCPPFSVDQDYIKWLSEKSSVTQVPGTDYLVNVDVMEDGLAIRANRWGTTYAPLTAWLTKHGIEWSEA